MNTGPPTLQVLRLGQRRGTLVGRAAAVAAGRSTHQHEDQQRHHAVTSVMNPMSGSSCSANVDAARE
jgi:hypothetical protein